MLFILRIYLSDSLSLSCIHQRSEENLPRVAFFVLYKSTSGEFVADFLLKQRKEGRKVRQDKARRRPFFLKNLFEIPRYKNFSSSHFGTLGMRLVGLAIFYYISELLWFLYLDLTREAARIYWLYYLLGRATLLCSECRIVHAKAERQPGIFIKNLASEAQLTFKVQRSFNVQLFKVRCYTLRVKKCNSKRIIRSKKVYLAQFHFSDVK